MSTLRFLTLGSTRGPISREVDVKGRRGPLSATVSGRYEVDGLSSDLVNRLDCSSASEPARSRHCEHSRRLTSIAPLMFPLIADVNPQR